MGAMERGRFEVSLGTLSVGGSGSDPPPEGLGQSGLSVGGF